MATQRAWAFRTERLGVAITMRRVSKNKNTFGLVVVIAAVVILCDLVPRVGAQQEDEPRVRRRGAASIDAALSDAIAPQADRLREGVVLTDKLGTFELAGDRIAFRLPDQEEPIGVLENLALERVWRMLDDTRGRQWRVTGRVTEYRGRNYLFLYRAVLRTQANIDTAKP